MTRWCRIVVLVLAGFYAFAGGMIPSPLAATGSNCVIGSAGTDDCPSACGVECPPVMCIVAPYAVPASPVPSEVRFAAQVAYEPAVPVRLLPHLPDPALRLPNA